MRARAEKNRRQLFGLHAPARVLVDLVPIGRVAVDAGANAGLYAWWIARSAEQVHAFEPHPGVYRRLARSVPKNVTSYNLGLSDAEGEAVLHVPPAGYGEANLAGHNDLDDVETVKVSLRTLDSYDFKDVGFLKIDVEGHEEPLLDGARETLLRSGPTIFVEIEERHNPGGITRIVSRMTALGYHDLNFMRAGAIHSMASFDVERDQGAPSSASPDYVNNFVFRP